jgi:hypothetical protein
MSPGSVLVEAAKPLLVEVAKSAVVKSEVAHLSTVRKKKRKQRRISNASAAPRILIVDDALINCRLLERTFRHSAKKLGIPSPSIVIAMNGLEAADLVKASLPSHEQSDVELGSHSLSFNLICLVLLLNRSHFQSSSLSHFSRFSPILLILHIS